jgi:L-2-hydroxyglutarate oxidase
MKTSRFVVVGGGIIGLATAYKLKQSFPDHEVTVLEKDEKVGRHQSTHNSGVLHAGLYYKPGSVKARMAVSGIRQMVAFCEKHEIPHERCGKLVVAVNESEIPRLKTLLERGTENGLNGLRWLKSEEMNEIEPNVTGLAAVHVPEEGIVDYDHVCKTLFNEIEKSGGRVWTSAALIHADKQNSEWNLTTAKGEVRADFVVNCAGLYCDRVSQMFGEQRHTRIVPFRGEYYQIKPERQSLVRNLIYPVPDPVYPFLGVHFTRLIHGGIEAGPNAVLAFAREGYRKTDFNPVDLFDALTFQGFWQFAFKHVGMCVEELKRSFSRKIFCQSLQKLVPAIQEDDLIPGGAGVRAQAMSEDGSLVQDFEILERSDVLHMLNAPSPGATASLAIGDELVQRIKKIRQS